MNLNNPRRRAPVTSIALLVSGGVLIVGTFLIWIKAPGGPVGFQGGTVGDEAAGTDFTLGLVTLGAGALAVVLAVVWLARRRSGVPVSTLSILAGIVALSSTIYFLVTLESRFIDFAAEEAAGPDLPASKIESLLERAFGEELLTVDPGVGLWIALAGSALVLTFALLSLRKGREGPSARELAGQTSQPMEGNQLPGSSV